MEQRGEVLSESDVNRIVTHMNEEHADDVLLLAQVHAGAPGATEAHMTSIDAEGLDLVAMIDGNEEALRIPFDEPLHTPEDAHRMLVDLALSARG